MQNPNEAKTSDAPVKKKRILKRALIIAAITLPVLLLAGWLIWTASGVKVTGRCAYYVDDYDEFILHKEWINIRPFINFGTGGSSGYKLWFLPGQKQKMLDKIKEDVNAELSDMVANYSNVFKSYEVSDDFKKVYFYYYKDVIWPYGLDVTEAIAPQIELYHQLIHGYGRTELSGIMNYVEVDAPPLE